MKCDGGARPSNPGPAAIGYTIEAEGWSDEGSDHLGKATNNEAEYHALVRGLEVDLEKGYTEVEARGDSQLIVRQVTGEWRTKEPYLCKLRDCVREVADEFEQFEIQQPYIPREENRVAVALVERTFDN